jgi:hypothetical protein
MSGQKLWFNRPMGEKMMKITILGGILIIAAVVAALIILDVSVENPSIAQLLSNIRNSIKNSALPGTGTGSPRSENLPGKMP